MPECTTPAECPAPPGECVTATCDNGMCGVGNLPVGTLAGPVVAGDCVTSQCDGNGMVVSVPNDADLPVDNSECTDDVCTSGVPSNPPLAAGSACNQGGGVICDGNGMCVECVTTNDCPGQDTVCQARTCDMGMCGVMNAPAGTAVPMQTPGDCQESQCNGAGMIVSVANDTDVPVDGNACTGDVCTGGVPSNPTLPAGTSCGASLVCDAGGQCVGCVTANDCPGSDTECQVRTCNAGLCGVNNTMAGTPVASQTPGDCQQNQCNGTGMVVSAPLDSDVPVDGNECTDDVCTSGVPSHPPEPAGTACMQNGGVVCDGMSMCVECVVDADCTGAGEACVSNACVVPATCSDGIQNQGEVGPDCGGPCPTCTVLLLGGGGSMLGAVYDGGTWTTSAVAGATTMDGMSLAVTTGGTGLGVVRNATDNQVRFTRWTMAGGWTSFAQVNTDTTRGRPAIAAETSGSGARLAFHGMGDFQFYVTDWSNGGWSASSQVLNFGPVPPAITRGTDWTVVFVNGASNPANQLFYRDQASGTVGAIASDPSFDTNTNIAPAVVTLTSGHQVAVYRSTGGQVKYAVRTGAMWSAADIADAATPGRVALAALPGGAAIAAFRGNNSLVYTTMWNGTIWSPPMAVSASLSTGTPPAITAGVGPATAEIAFVNNSTLMHSRLIGGAWTTPATVGGSSLNHVAIARAN